MVFIQKAKGKEFCLDILNLILSATQEHDCQIPNYTYIYFSRFLLGRQWNDNKTKSQGIGKNMSDL